MSSVGLSFRAQPTGRDSPPTEACHWAEWSRVHNYLRHQFGNSLHAEDLEDIAQTTFLRVWRRCSRCPDSSVAVSPRAYRRYLLITARRAAIDAYRRGRTRKAREGAYRPAPPPSQRSLSRERPGDLAWWLGHLCGLSAAEERGLEALLEAGRPLPSPATPADRQLRSRAIRRLRSVIAADAKLSQRVLDALA